ncbi:hypothetical protein PWT90_02179 [Aphanocladium album]|nr:hypothetical protein PWT90_02179 [Aphanocladium album]
MANAAHQVAAAVNALRQELGTMSTEIRARFNEADAARAGLRTHIDKAENNIRQHCDFGTLNIAVAQLRTALGSIATSMQDNHSQLKTQLTSAETAIITVSGEAVQTLQDRLVETQDRIILAAADSRTQIVASITAAQTNILNAVGDAQQTITTATTAIQATLTGIIAGFGDHVSQMRDAIITATTQARDYIIQNTTQARNTLQNDIVNLQTHLELNTTAFTGLSTSLDTKLNGIQNATNAAQAAATAANNELVREFNEIVRGLTKKVDEVQLEMRAGHYNSAVRLANRMSSCCKNTIFKLRGIDNEIIRGIPSSYGALHGLPSSIDDILHKLYLHRSNCEESFSKKEQRLKMYLGLRK